MFFTLKFIIFVRSADELLVTELLFNGVFNDLTPEQCCALLSCFAFQEKSQRFPRMTEQLSGPLRLMQVGNPHLHFHNGFPDDPVNVTQFMSGSAHPVF